MVVGLLLAAGAGRRYGMPKALAGDGEWLCRSVAALRDGGCGEVVVVLGAEHERAATLVPDGARTVVAHDWADGMGASLRAGLAALNYCSLDADCSNSGSDNCSLHPDCSCDAAIVHLVDLPDVSAAVIRRVAALAAPEVVARAAYDGTPGHPVLLGREHWAAVSGGASGDRGARDWLSGRSDLVLVDCTDLATGVDVDRPE